MPEEQPEFHQVLLATLSSQTEANARFTSAVGYDQQVIEPFIAGQVQQAQQQSWMTERLNGLSKPALVDQMNTAAEAARSLQQAWAKLLSNDLTAAEIQSITAELAPVIASLEALKPTTTDSGTTGSTGETQP